METFQLPLIAQLSLSNVFESPPSRTMSKQPGATQLPYLNAVQALFQGPVPLAQLVRLEGVADEAVLVQALRQFGLELHIRQVPVFDANYNVNMADVCALTTADVRRVNRTHSPQFGPWLAV